MWSRFPYRRLLTCSRLSYRLPFMLSECSRVGLSAEPVCFDAVDGPKAGPTQAHEHAWREWLGSRPDEDSLALFVEDDTRFLRDLPMLRDMLAAAPNDADFLFLGWHCWATLPRLRGLPAWFPLGAGPRSNICMFNCYALRPRAAREMLRIDGHRDPNLETDLRISWLDGSYKVYACAPLAAVAERVGANTSANEPDQLIQGTARKYVSDVFGAYALNLFDMRPKGPMRDGLLDLCRRVGGGTFCEVGSYAGQSARIMLDSGLVTKLFAVDPWEPGYDPGDEASGTDMGVAEQEFDRIVGSDRRVVKCKGRLEDYAKMLSGQRLDCVYIDADHRYEPTKSTISLARSLSPRTLGGHDYCRDGVTWPGVKRAVDEAFGGPDFTFADTSWLKVL